LVWRRLVADIRPLRGSPAFRRLWIGSTLSSIGGQMTSFAVALQIYTATHSSVAVGGVGLAIAVPGVVVGLAAGSIIDAVDRRRLVLVATSSLTAVSGLFAVQAFAGLDIGRWNGPDPALKCRSWPIDGGLSSPGSPPPRAVPDSPPSMQQDQRVPGRPCGARWTSWPSGSRRSTGPISTTPSGPRTRS
jgi:hypothetical protein